MRWHSAHVETPVLPRLEVAEWDRILNTIALAEEIGAGTAVPAHADAAKALVERAQRLELRHAAGGRGASSACRFPGAHRPSS